MENNSTSKYIPGDLLYNSRVDCYYLILAVNENSWLGPRYYFLDMSSGIKDYEATGIADNSKHLSRVE